MMLTSVMSSTSLTFLVLTACVLSSIQAQKCEVCPNGGSHTNPTGIIPQLLIPGKPNPTCEDAIAYAGVVDSNTDTCELLQQQAAFCGCEGVTAPANRCTLCENGQPPDRGSRETVYGDTCDELNTYLSFLSVEDCQTERGQDLLRHAFGCQCPGASTECAMCPDGTIDLQHSDKVVPFFSETISGSGEPTCEELALIAASTPSESIACELIQDQAGYCGCAEVDPINVCSFCPGREAPDNYNLETNTKDTCGDLHEYMTYMNLETCESKRAADIRELGFVCGCPKAEPSCTLCIDGSPPPDPDLRPDGEDGLTCGEIALATAGLTRDACEDARNSEIGTSAFRCGCPGATMVACSSQQNPDLCTEELLLTATELCECYSFCDGEFYGCSNYPGGLLSPQLCQGEPIAGCNAATAIRNEQQSQPNTTSSASIVSVSVVLWGIWAIAGVVTAMI